MHFALRISRTCTARVATHLNLFLKFISAPYTIIMHRLVFEKNMYTLMAHGITARDLKDI